MLNRSVWATAFLACAALVSAADSTSAAASSSTKVTAVPTAAATGTPANVVVAALANIQNRTLVVNHMVEDFDLLKVLQLQNANRDIIDTINSGTTEVQGIGNLEFNDAGPLFTAVNGIVQTVNLTIGTVLGQYENFGGLAPVVLSFMQKQRDATVQLSTAISAKLPQALVSTAYSQTELILNSFKEGIDKFNITPVNRDPSLYTTGAASTLPALTGWTALLLVVATFLVL